jgi:hypothetical protein
MLGSNYNAIEASNNKLRSNDHPLMNEQVNEEKRYF